MNISYYYQHLSLFINPVAFSVGSFSVRWYSLSYLVGFLVVYFILAWRIKKGEAVDIFQAPNLVIDFLLVEFFSLLVGGRLGYVLFYNFSYFAQNPSAIISPYDRSGNLVGLYGMSYFGALIGALAGGYIFCKIKKLNFLRWADFVVVALPAGYFFGRVGNFLNGELYGRVTTSPLGMYFAQDPTVLRHPSQLYEAFFEGFLLFVVLWAIRKKRLFGVGSLLLIYLLGYGAVRFVVEFFRQPDPQVGVFFLGLTLGQILSLVTATASVVLLFFKSGNDGILSNVKNYLK